MLAVAAVLVLAVFAIGLRRPHAEGVLPFVPGRDGEVVEHLVARVGMASAPGNAAAASSPLVELRTARRALRQEPRNRALATRVARLAIEAGRATGDPRFYGQAQGALDPWWHGADPPDDVLLLRATLRQNAHEFPAALADLNLLVARSPGDVQGWLTRAVVLTVRGEFPEAARSCDALQPLTAPLVFAVCTGTVESLTGKAAVAYDRIATAMKELPAEGAAAERGWALSTLGEVAARKGDAAAAERHFLEALTTDPRDVYVLGALADLLLDHGRGAEVIPRLQAFPEHDALLLRLALAEKATKHSKTAEHVATLAARFEASRQRGDGVHGREESRFQRVLMGDPKKALVLAQANWEVQHEPWDVRVLLEAALDANDLDAAVPAGTFVTATHLEDPAVAPLIARLGDSRVVP